MTKRIMDVVRNEALRENALLKKSGLNGHYIPGADKAGTRGAEKIKNMSLQPFFRAPIVDLTEEPISLLNYINCDPHVRQTYGHYTLKYVPKARRVLKTTRNFQIITDLLAFVPSVCNYDHFIYACKKIPELDWMRRNTNISKGLFDIAAKHPGTPFEFSVDWVRYGNMIEQKAAEKGIDIDGHPFVAYRTTNEKMAELNDKYRLGPLPDKKYYAEALNEEQ